MSRAMCLQCNKEVDVEHHALEYDVPEGTHNLAVSFTLIAQLLRDRAVKP